MPLSNSFLETATKATVRNLVFYTQNEELRVRQKSFRFKFPYTTNQVNNQLSVSPLIEFYRIFKPFLYNLLNDRPSNLSAYQQFFKNNLNYSVIGGVIDYSQLTFSNNNFSSTNFTIENIFVSGNNLKITWLDDSNAEKLSTDLLCLVILNVTSNINYFIISDFVRSDLEAFFSIPNMVQDDNCYFHAFFQHSNFYGSSVQTAFNFLFDSPSQLSTVNYGLLYNHFAISDSRFCPAGYHIPSISNINAIGTTLGGNSVAGGKMKTTGTTLWNSPNTGATNESGFNGKPAGWRNYLGSFGNLHNYHYFWTSALSGSQVPYLFYLRNTYESISLTNFSKLYGFSARFIKDDSNDVGYMRDYSGNNYPTVKIGNIVVSAENYKGTHFSDDSEIPYISSASEWAELSTPARCAYQNGEDYI